MLTRFSPLGDVLSFLIYLYTDVGFHDGPESPRDRITNLRRNVVIKVAGGKKLFSTLSLTINVSSCTAFFKLRFSIGKAAAIHLYIPPEHIISITQRDKPVNDVTPHAARQDQSNYLEFLLDTSARLIGPVGQFLPLQKAETELLDAVARVASQLTLFISLPSQAFTRHQLQLVCNVAARTLWTSCPDHSALHNAYGGQGAQELRLQQLHQASTRGIENPPSYNHHTINIGVSEPKRPDKRRRSDTDSDSDPLEHAALFRTICQTMMAQQRVELRAELLAELAKMEKSIIKKTIDLVNKRSLEIKTEILEEIDYDKIEDDVAEEVLPRVIDEVRDEFETCIEDRVCGIKIEMEDFVKEEMKNVESNLTDTMENGTWQFTASAD